MPGLMMERTANGSLPKGWDIELDEAPVSVGWSAGGRWLAAASADGAVYVFESERGGQDKRWDAHRFGAIAVAWHPREDLFASAGQDGRTALWTPVGESPVASLDCGNGWVEHLAWSPSGQYLATACGRILRLWSASGELLRSFEQQPNTIAGIDWRSDSSELVSACYGQVVFWSPLDSSPKRRFLWKGSILSLAWSPDARYLCHGNQDSTVHFWIVATGKELQMCGYPLKVAQLCWERRSKYLATAGSPQITVWDCSGKGPAGRKPQTLTHHTSPIRAMRFQKDGPLLASGCAEGRIAVWRPSKRETPDATAYLGSPVIDVAWGPGTERLAVAVEDGRVVTFHLAARSD